MATMRIAFHLVSLALMLNALSAPALASQPSAEWTIMIYLNAKNDLEDAGLENFKDMAKVNDSSKVNLVVQMGRKSHGPFDEKTPAAEIWSGAKRFLVKKGTQAIAADQVMDLEQSGLSTDMGIKESLDNFVRWAMRTYPAKRTMLVIWSHGQGWRLRVSKNGQRGAAAKQYKSTNLQELAQNAIKPLRVNGYKAVSFDAETGHTLYNRGIQDVLLSLKKEGWTPDIIAFDACLMSMFETAYAMRNVASYLVGSQELEPDSGWAYDDLLPRLYANPLMSAKDLSETVVRSYSQNYLPEGDHTTQTAIDLSKVPAAAIALTAFAKTLVRALPTERANISAARAKQDASGSWSDERHQTSIDLLTFLENFAAMTTNVEVARSAKDAAAATRAMIARHYASKNATKRHNALGLGIYFPATREAFTNDSHHDGYLPGNVESPVEFVEREGWAGFLRTYLGIEERSQRAQTYSPLQSKK
jgi:hypothetical protein